MTQIAHIYLTVAIMMHLYGRLYNFLEIKFISVMCWLWQWNDTVVHSTILSNTTKHSLSVTATKAHWNYCSCCVITCVQPFTLPVMRTMSDLSFPQNAELCASATYSSGLRGYSSYSPHLRRSLPNMHHMSSEPPKIYPAHLLLVTNYRLPNDVDRCHLEVSYNLGFFRIFGNRGC